MKKKGIDRPKKQPQATNTDRASDYRSGYGPEGWIGYSEWAKRVEAEKKKK